MIDERAELEPVTAKRCSVKSGYRYPIEAFAADAAA